MKPNDIEQKLKRIAKELSRYIKQDAPIIIGTEAVNFFSESFENEGFTDKNLVKWKEVKRRLNAREGKRKASAKYKILSSERNNLSESLNFHIQGKQVIITSDVEYAEAHNEGTNHAGRNRNVSIPKRQFVGKSQKLDEIIEKEITKDLKRIFNS